MSTPIALSFLFYIIPSFNTHPVTFSLFLLLLILCIVSLLLIALFLSLLLFRGSSRRVLLIELLS